LALGCAVSAAGSAVYYAHSSAAAERARMHVGVLRDIAAEEAAAAATVAAAVSVNAATASISSSSTTADTLQKRLNPKVVAGGLQRSASSQSSQSKWSPTSSLSSNTSPRHSPIVASAPIRNDSLPAGAECINGVCELKQTRFKTPKVQ